MKFKIEKTKVIEVDLSDKEVSTIAIAAIKRVLRLPDEHLYIMYRDNIKYLCYDEEVYTSHKFDIRHEIRPVSDADEFLIDLLEKLDSYK